MIENICHFIPSYNNVYTIRTINFVFETKPQQYTHLRSESVYKMYYVCTGTGCIHTAGKITPLKQGDVFFTFPASPFAIESNENFTYMYISFVGNRGNKIMEELKICSNNFVFHDVGQVHGFWKNGIITNTHATDLISESILLYTFSVLSERAPKKQPKTPRGADFIKKYIDEHFSDCNFSLNSMSTDLSYNKKYLSHAFKKTFGIGISEYLNIMRIQNACTMIGQGFTSVSDIADRCGYSDPQYFSKIFKSKMGVLPTQYIKQQTKG